MNTLINNKNFVTKCGASLLFAIGALVLFLWHNPTALAATYPKAVVMAYNTAVCVILLSVSLFALVHEKQQIIKICAATIFLISGLTFIESFFGFSVGVHYWFTQTLTTLPPSPGLMSPVTASCLLLASTSLQLMNMATGKNNLIITTIFLNFIVVTIATISLLGYGIGLIPAFGWLGIKMAPHTAIGLIIFSATLIFNIYRHAINTFNRLKFFYRVITGFGFMALLVIAIGSAALTQINTVSSITQELYQNPLQVNNAALRIKTEINAINRALKNIAINPTMYPNQKIPNDIKIAKSSIIQNIVFIRKNEPSMIANINDFETGFSDWEKFVLASCELLEIKDYIKFEQRTLYSSQEQIGKLETILERISLHAQMRMAELNTLATNTKNDAKNLIYIIVTIFLVAGLLVSVLITRSLTSQLQKIRQFMLNIADEKLGQPIPFLDHPQEIGDMARTLEKFEENILTRLQLEKRLRQVIEATPNGIIMINTSGTIEIVNAQAEQIFGYDRSELLGKPIAQLIPTTIAQNPAYNNETFFTNPSSEAIKTIGKMGAGHELFGLRQDGSEFPLEIGLAPIETDDGMKVLAAIVDITERKHIAAALNSSRELLELTTRINQIGVWEYKLENNQLIWNEAMFDIYGRNKEFFTADYNAWKQCVHPDDIVNTEKLFEESIRTLTPYLSKFRIILPDGSIKHIHAKAKVERIIDNHQLRILGTNIDITREQMAYEKVHNLEALRSAIVEFSEDGIISKTPYGIITSWNTGATNMFGYTADEAIGHSISDLLFPEDRREEEQLLLSDVRSEIVVQHFETIHRCKDGRLLNVSITLSPIKDTAGNIVGISAIKRDITEAIKSRELLAKRQHELEKSNQELDRSNKELETFAYVASHDLKSPLRGITQLSSWIDEDLVKKEYAAVDKHTQMLRNRIQRMEKLLDDLLIFYRAGKGEGTQSTIHLSQMAKEIFEIQNTNAGLHLETTANLPTFATLSTPFEQVLRNLFSNAIKHHDREMGLIRLSYRELNEYFYEFTVCDDGPGIPEKFQQRIFGMFQTLKPRDELEGSGMGLALIKKIVENYGGQITLVSTGRGCCFSFSWPKTM